MVVKSFLLRKVEKSLFSKRIFDVFAIFVLSVLTMYTKTKSVFEFMRYIKLSFRFSSFFDGIPESIDLTDAGIAKNATPNKMADRQTGMTIIFRKPNSVLYSEERVFFMNIIPAFLRKPFLFFIVNIFLQLSKRGFE